MKLRGRFTLWFCLAALVPIVAAALVTRTILSSTYREVAERSRKTAEEETRRVLSMLEAEVSVRIEQLATREDLYVGGTLLDLDTHNGALPPWSTKSIRDTGGPLMRQLALDLMYLLDHRGVVLDAPHYRPAVGEDASNLRQRAKESQGKAYYVMEAILEDNTIKRRLVVESARQLKEGRYSTTIVGARLVDSRVLEPLRQLDGVEVRIISAEGDELVAPAEPWRHEGEVFSHDLLGSDGSKYASVELRVKNDALPQLLRTVTLFSALLALGALIVTVLLGFWVARRMTRDLDALVAGAQSVAHGDLEHSVAVRSTDEIGEVGQAFNMMMIDLKDSKERLVMAERVAAWQEIARRLAHEIKNPLTPIQMSVETLRKTWAKKHPSFDEIFEESTATILEEAGRLKRIVSEFSEFARMPSPQKAPLNLNDLIRSQLALYKGSVHIVKELEKGLPIVEADRDTLSQLLLNLVENARDALAGDPTGTITVTTMTTRDGKAVAMVVDDNGPGIAPENRDKLFTPYFTTKHAHGGTGLGLAIAHRIVSDHGGKMIAGDNPNGGARFTVELPAEGAGGEVLIASMSGSMKRFR